jgi:Zn-dependent membrane protease YugP
MWAQLVLIVGLLLVESFPALFWVGIAMFAMIVLFSMITLPVEYNASNRALAWLERSNSLTPVQVEQAQITLNWAARTYVVSALSALATLIYYLGFARDND